MPSITILRDNREQLPYEFEHFNVQTEDVTLKTGDYTLAEFCDRDEVNDTYLPRFAVERKTGEDFLGSITQSRKRFRKEIERCELWSMPLEVVVEEPWTTFTHNINFMKRREVSPNQVTGTVSRWTDRYNVNFFFAGDRLNGEQHTYDLLTSWYRATVE